MKTLHVLVALISSVLIALDSVLSEAVMSAFNVHPLVVSTIPVLIGSTILFSIIYIKDNKTLRKFDRKYLLKIFATSFFGAIGLFLWFDGVTRIGASKELLLSTNTSEVLFVLLLSFVFLKEKISKTEALGSFMIITGIFLLLFNPSMFSLSFGLGETEAILSSLAFAIAIVIATDVLKKLDAKIVASIYLIIEGLILLVPTYLFQINVFVSILAFVSLLILGIISALSVLTYNLCLKKVGAYLTVVLGSLSGLFSIVLQLLFSYLLPSVKFIFPSSLILAIAGSVFAVLGVILIGYKNK
jgi:drug/metabolite transporter (DMT)-like permease